MQPWLLVLLFATSCAVAVRAQDVQAVKITDFSTSSQLVTLAGTAAVTGSTLTLLPDLSTTAASVWFHGLIPVRAGFVFEVIFTTSCTASCGEGFAFVVQAQSQSYLGHASSHLAAYQTPTSNYLVIELDSVKGTDPLHGDVDASGSHVAVATDQSQPTVVVPLPFTVGDAKPHKMRVEYRSRDNHLSVSFPDDKGSIIELDDFDFDDFLWSEDGAYVGMTGATSSMRQSVVVTSISIAPTDEGVDGIIIALLVFVSVSVVLGTVYVMVIKPSRKDNVHSAIAAARYDDADDDAKHTQQQSVAAPADEAVPESPRTRDSKEDAAPDEAERERAASPTKAVIDDTTAPDAERLSHGRRRRRKRQAAADDSAGTGDIAELEGVSALPITKFGG